MREFTVENRVIKIKELTVIEIRDWINDEIKREGKQEEIDLVSEWLMPDVSIDTLLRITDLTKEEVDKIKPSDLAELVQVCKEVNSHFFSLRDRIVHFGTEVLEQD